MKLTYVCPRCSGRLEKCISSFLPDGRAVYPPHIYYWCRTCGIMVENIEDKIASVNYDGDDLVKVHVLPSGFKTDCDPCKNCNNHPVNGGSGVCHCIIGVPKLAW